MVCRVSFFSPGLFFRTKSLVFPVDRRQRNFFSEQLSSFLSPVQVFLPDIAPGVDLGPRAPGQLSFLSGRWVGHRVRCFLSSIEQLSDFLFFGASMFSLLGFLGWPGGGGDYSFISGWSLS